MGNAVGVKIRYETSQIENGYASSMILNLVAFNQNRNDAARGIVRFDGLNRFVAHWVLFAMTHFQPAIDLVG